MWKEPIIPSCKAGDILGFSCEGWTGLVIPVATGGIPFWDLSHVGIVAETNKGLVLFESTTSDFLPCLMTGRRHPYGVQAHRIEEVVRLYHAKIWHYPLCTPLSNLESSSLSEFLISMLGVKYNALNAMRSAFPIRLSIIDRLIGNYRINGVFCSNLCAAAHSITGRFDTTKPGKWNPRKFVNEFVRERGILCPPKRCK